MIDGAKVYPHHFTGPLADELQAFLSEKRRTGHKYGVETSYLGSIDRLSIQMGTAQGVLTKELTDAWTQKKDSESHKTWQNRVIVIRQLARYLKAQGLSAYETTCVIHNKRSAFVPHIYTNSELRRIFEQADKCPAYTNCPNRNAVASLLFRLVYACGLRISEALNLRLKDVDLERGVLTISNSKFGTNRYVPMSDELTLRCHIFMKKIHLSSNQEDVFFPAPDHGRYSHRTVTCMFHQILSKAEIPRTRSGPRIHDFRHTFSVNCLKRWVREGKDLTTALPILSTYLGHKSLDGTQDYLRLTADMFPDISSAVETRFGSVIPMGGVDNEEE